MHYVKGGSIDNVCFITGIDKSNLTKACAAVEKVAAAVELVKELDWQGLVK